MSVYAGPEIVSNGLVLALDAGNTKSYPGTGSTWTDLSGGGNSGTLTNGPTFDGGNGGSIVFDAIDDNINLGTNSNIRNFSQNNTAFTLDCLVKKGSVTNASAGPLGFMLFNNNDGGWIQGWSIGIRNVSGGVNTVVFQIGLNGSSDACSYSCSYGLIDNQWTHIAISHSVTNLSSTCVFYKNGVLLQSSSSTIASLGSGSSYNNRIGRQISASWQGHNSQGQISSYKIYNRVLTATEIQQNFNALRGRFGI